MHNIIFYKDPNGNELVYEYLVELAKKSNKDSRIKLNKINDYIEILKQYGTFAGEPYVKHLDDEIWELRPLRDRILFAGTVNNEFVLLHVFQKKTRKTPRKEILKAKKELEDYISRKDDEND